MIEEIIYIAIHSAEVDLVRLDPRGLAHFNPSRDRA